MPNQIQKSLQSYISKIKNNPSTSKSLSKSTSWILRGCKNPRTLSFSADRHRNPNQIETLQENSTDSDDHVELTDENGGENQVKEAAAAGSSTGIRHDDEAGRDQLRPDYFITVLKDSDNQYEDFRNSMQEMMDARVRQNGKINWEFMEELLLCYLDLNDKKSHRFILGAFVDLIVHLRENHDGGGGASASPEVGSKGKNKV